MLWLGASLISLEMFDNNSKEKNMSMTRLILGFATLPLLAGVALAAPTQLTDRQMDKIAAGSDFHEEDDSNGAIVVVSVHERFPNAFADQVSSSAHPDSVNKCINVTATCGPATPPTPVAGNTNPSLAGTNFIGGSVNPGGICPGGGASGSCGYNGGSPYYLLINNYALSVGAAFR